MNNPMQIMQMMRNPQAMIQNFMSNSQLMSNPMNKNALELAQKQDIDGLYQLARNMCQTQGRDFDKEFSQFKSNLCIK